MPSKPPPKKLRVKNLQSNAAAKEMLFKTSPMERKFAALWSQRFPDLPLEREVVGIPGRRFRFDFASVAAKVAVEIHGGIWGRKSAHNSGTGIERDHEKQCLSSLVGWAVFPITEKAMGNTALLDGIAEMIRSRTGVAADGGKEK